MQNCIILGCGPSGLVAAHAAQDMGYTPIIMSEGVKSNIYGAQFLHAPIPNTNDPTKEWVEWQHLAGDDGQYDPEPYLRKVYGVMWDRTVSTEMYNTGQVAWDLRAVYDELWGRYSSMIFTWSYSPVEMESLRMAYLGSPWINTIPRKVLCRTPRMHTFVSTPIWAMGDSPARQCHYRPNRNTIVYNGNPSPAWYRVSNIFGHVTMEWPGINSNSRPLFAGVARVQKPLSTDCNCWPGVHHTGRFGKWQKGFLLHQVYEDVQQYLKDGVQGVLL